MMSRLTRTFYATDLPSILNAIVLLCLTLLMASPAQAAESLTSVLGAERWYAGLVTGSTMEAALIHELGHPKLAFDLSRRSSAKTRNVCAQS